MVGNDALPATPDPPAIFNEPEVDAVRSCVLVIVWPLTASPVPGVAGTVTVVLDVAAVKVAAWVCAGKGTVTFTVGLPIFCPILTAGSPKPVPVPTTERPRKSGSPKVVEPSPPNWNPNREYNA